MLRNCLSTELVSCRHFVELALKCARILCCLESFELDFFRNSFDGVTRLRAGIGIVSICCKVVHFHWFYSKLVD